MSSVLRQSSRIGLWKTMPTSVTGPSTRARSTVMLPLVDRVESGHQAHQRRLAAARRPDDDDELAGDDVDVELLQRERLLAAAR